MKYLLSHSLHKIQVNHNQVSTGRAHFEVPCSENSVCVCVLTEYPQLFDESLAVMTLHLIYLFGPYFLNVLHICAEYIVQKLVKNI